MELVQISNGKSVTTSRLIAEKFNKQHTHVLRDIKSLNCSVEFNASNFGLVEYLDSKGESRPEYIITRDGFTFLAMGFTGEKAASFKEEYIAAFNYMEHTLLTPSEDEVILRAINTLNIRVEENRLKLERANNVIKEQAPIVQYAKEVLDADGLIPTTIIAKDLGMSAKALNKTLSRMGVLFKMAETWVLYSRYQNMGYTHTKTHSFTDSTGAKKTAIHTFWTERGRRFIHELINKKKLSA